MESLIRVHLMAAVEREEAAKIAALLMPS